MPSRLAERIGQERYELWFGRHTQFCWGERGLTVLAASTFTRDWLRRNFAADVSACCQTLAGQDVHVEFEVDASALVATGEATCKATAGADAVPPCRAARAAVAKPGKKPGGESRVATPPGAANGSR